MIPTPKALDMINCCLQSVFKKLFFVPVIWLAISVQTDMYVYIYIVNYVYAEIYVQDMQYLSKRLLCKLCDLFIYLYTF